MTVSENSLKIISQKSSSGYHIAICDDDIGQIELLSSMFAYINGSVFISKFTSAEALWNHLKTSKENHCPLPDIILADVKMPKMNGITFGRQLHDAFPDIFLVLISAYREYAIQGYETNAFRFLLKPISQQDITNLLGAVSVERGKRKAMILSGLHNEALLPLSEILYISAEDKYTIIYTTEERFMERYSLNDFEALLSVYGFFRTHRKYLVNITHHKAIESNSLILDTGQRLPISLRRISPYRTFIFDYLKEELI